MMKVKKKLKQNLSKTVIIDKKLIDYKKWKSKAQVLAVYALDWCTIGVTPSPSPNWLNYAFNVKLVPYIETKSYLAFILPDDFANFYLINQSKITISGMQDRVLITVTHPNVKDCMVNNRKVYKGGKYK